MKIDPDKVIYLSEDDYFVRSIEAVDMAPDGSFMPPKREYEELSDKTDVSVIPKYEEYMRQHFQTVNANPIKKGA